MVKLEKTQQGQIYMPIVYFACNIEEANILEDIDYQDKLQ